MENKIETLIRVLDGLMSRYKQRVPDVAAILNAMINEKINNRDRMNWPVKNSNRIKNENQKRKTFTVRLNKVSNDKMIFSPYMPPSHAQTIQMIFTQIQY